MYGSVDILNFECFKWERHNPCHYQWPNLTGSCGATPSASKSSSSFTNLLSPSSSLVNGCESWTLLTDSVKRTQAFETKCPSTRPTAWYGARSTLLWVYRNTLQLPRDGNLQCKLHGLGMPHATTASPKPSFMAPRRMGGVVVGRGNA